MDKTFRPIFVRADVPGPSGAGEKGSAYSMPRVGNLAVQAACPPQALAHGLGMVIPCAAVLENVAGSPVALSVQAVSASGTPRSSVTTTRLNPGGKYALNAPPAGASWLVVDLSRPQVDAIVWWGLAGLTAVGGFALYGVYATARDLYRRWHHPRGR